MIVALAPGAGPPASQILIVMSSEAEVNLPPSLDHAIDRTPVAMASTVARRALASRRIPYLDGLIVGG